MSYKFKTQDAYELASIVGTKITEKGNELFFEYCPYCGGSKHDRYTCSVNSDTGAFKCFRASCQKQGHFAEMARDFHMALDMGENSNSIKTYRSMPQKSISSTSNAIDYMATRGISADICKRYKITTCKDNANILVFPFYDENNVLVAAKYRNTKFRKGRDKNKEWYETGTKPVLFGMAQCENFETLVITEGQIDSLSLSECGIKNAVSVPTGATGFTWLANCWDWVVKFKQVIVFGDYEKGKITLLDTLSQRLPQKVYQIPTDYYLGEKDANAILTTYGKQALIDAIDHAELPKIKNVKDLSEVKSVDINLLPKIKTNIREIDKIIGGLIFGQVVLLTGKRGEGKSTFMSQLVAEALDQNYNTFIYSGELADYHFKRWLDFQLAGKSNIITNRNVYGDEEYSISNETVEAISQWYKGRAFIYDNNFIPENTTEIEGLINTIENTIKQYDTRLICIDNLMTAMDEVNDNNNLYLAQSNFVGKLKKIAVRYDVVIVLVAHPRKSKDAFVTDDVSGSADITNKVDIVMAYERSAEDDNTSDGKLQITKNRLTGKLALSDNAVKLFYSPDTKRISSASSSSRRQYGWDKISDPLDDLDEIPF